MEEIMYGKEIFKKKNGYSKKKPLTAAERKEKTKQKHSKLIDRIRKLSECEDKENIKIENKNNDTVEKPSIEQLKSLVQSIENNNK